MNETIHTNRADARAAGARYFYPESGCRNGHAPQRRTANGMCMECSLEYSKTRDVKARAAAYRNSPHGRAIKEARRLSPVGKAQMKSADHRARLQRYGITNDDYEAILKQQGEGCAICHTAFKETPCIDHCHTTGEMRGLLCDQCNRGLGYFKDSINSLTEAIEYLKQYGS